jgi:uncharacterized protein (TIGR01777 family)
MRVFVTGATGLVGRRLMKALLNRGDSPVVLSRRAEQARTDPAFRGTQVVQGDPVFEGAWQAAVDGCDAVVHLAGHNIFAERWSEEVKRKIHDSRVISTEHVAAAIASASSRPKVLVQAAAIGYYGACGDEELTETSPPGNDFMAQVCQEWERASSAAAGAGTRVVRVRIGVVLAKGGGALGVMGPIFKCGPGMPIGGRIVARGSQWLSWIHIDDLVGILLLALDRDDATGAMNGTAPNPVRNREFARTFSNVLWRPTRFWRLYVPIGPPDFALALLLGDVAGLITTGQRVLPAAAQSLGYQFKFPALRETLLNLFPRAEPATATSVASAATGKNG